MRGLEPKPVTISEFPGLPADIAARLSDMGITTSKDFYDFAVNPDNISTISRKFNVAADTLQELSSLCNLVRINGIGAIAAKILHNSGYNSIAVIAQAESEELLKCMKAINEDKRYFKTELGEKDMQFIIDAANIMLAVEINDMSVSGKQVDLIPATPDDKKNIYEWCYHSEITKSHAGLPDYPNAPIASQEEFFNGVGGYSDYYFTGFEPGHGRGFIISHAGTPVGFLSYSAFHLQQRKAELDIWMNCEANCGKGFGTDAIIALGKYLNQSLETQELIMRPSVKNVRAIRSYEKAGLKKSDKRPEEYLLGKYISIFGDGDYGADESALLIKVFDEYESTDS